MNSMSDVRPHLTAMRYALAAAQLERDDLAAAIGLIDHLEHAAANNKLSQEILLNTLGALSNVPGGQASYKALLSIAKSMDRPS